MAFDFLKEKKAARQVLHERLAVSSKHISAATGRVSDCRVRVHTRINLIGDVDYQGFAEMSEGVVVILCTITEARALNFSPNDKIIYDGEEYILHTQMDDDRVYIEKWQATHNRREYP
nr:MAG TPA: Tail attachment protein [Caudoviricetes sp.]